MKLRTCKEAKVICSQVWENSQVWANSQVWENSQVWANNPEESMEENILEKGRNKEEGNLLEEAHKI